MALIFDPAVAYIWENECNVLIESFPENDRLIAVQADDLLALIEAWRKREL